MPKKKQQQPKQEPVQTNERSDLSTERFRKSDRLLMALAGTRNRIGASCNVYACEDSIESIAKAHAWALHVSHQQGAPSIYYGNLRPRGSTIATGGVSGGAVPFMHMFDAGVHWIKRDTYKKGAGIAWLPWHHPDLREFLEADFKSIYRGVLLPEQNSKVVVDEDTKDLLVQAYEKGKCFLCKAPAPKADGTPRYLNLCTEVEIVSEDMCVLGVVNLSQYTPDNIRDLSFDFVQAATEMKNDSSTTRQIKYHSPLRGDRDELQFGLGVSGLASTLANWNISYETFVRQFELVLSRSHPTIDNVLKTAHELYEEHLTPVSLLLFEIVSAYAAATRYLRGSGVVRAFCVQPSATGAYECADASGFHSSPELQPVIGIRDERGVHTTRKSQLRGDTEVTFHPRTETIEDVPYALYARLCECWQMLLNSTGLAHRHSACFYGQEFTVADYNRFVASEQLSLYYRLPYYNPTALDKTNVGEGLAFDETDFNVDGLLFGASCGVQKPDDSDCGCGQ